MKRIKLDKVMQLCNDNREHSFEFVVKGQKQANRKGGYTVQVKGIVTSTNFHQQTLNILITESEQTRKFYFILMLKYEDIHVFY